MDDVVVGFDAATQSLGALKEAAYRLIGEATCQIKRAGDTYHCHLASAHGSKLSEAALRTRFLDLVTDENLREKLAEATEPTRNLVLALAFGALAQAAEAERS